MQEGLEASNAENYLNARTLLQPIAEQGNAEAECIMGNFYQLGLGVEIDRNEAINWYRKSATQGYGVAANNLAGMLPQPEADWWYRQARDLGFAHAPSQF